MKENTNAYTGFLPICLEKQSHPDMLIGTPDEQYLKWYERMKNVTNDCEYSQDTSVCD